MSIQIAVPGCTEFAWIEWHMKHLLLSLAVIWTGTMPRIREQADIIYESRNISETEKEARIKS